MKKKSLEFMNKVEQLKFFIISFNVIVFCGFCKERKVSGSPSFGLISYQLSLVER